jgi:tRNA A-37 threonylcarbamoyl transferase component Bud32
MPVEAQPGRTLGRYVVESAIGEGGFATVFRAVDTVLGRPVALKVLDPVAQRDPTVARRFLREGRAVASLDHHAIVPVYDAGEDDGLLWLAMRLIEGRSLAEVLDGGRRPTGDEVVALVDRIGPALDHAHAQGVVHRDVKPSNILLESGDPTRAWLADFGIAATARTAGRYTTGMLGTAAYMAPEQARPHEVGPPADIYSLGCVVYELVTGRRPFPGDDHVALLMAHATLRVPPSGDARLDRVLARALAKDPAARPPSGAALAGELRAAGAAGRHVPAPSGPGAVVDDAATARAAPTLVAPGTRRIPPPPPPGAGAPHRRPPPPPAPTSVRPRDPTVSRRGRSRAVRNLVLGITALSLAAVALLVAARDGDRSGGVDGVRQCDEAGVCFTVLDGWSVGDVQQGRVVLERSEDAAAEYRHQPVQAGDPVEALAAAGAQVCADRPVAARVGDAEGARCSGPQGERVAAAIAGGTLWLITVDAGVPGDEGDAFVASFEFG